MNSLTKKVYTDESLFPFGKKHKNKRMIDVPAHYLLWLYDNGCDHEGVMQYIQNNLDALNKEAGKGRR